MDELLKFYLDTVNTQNTEGRLSLPGHNDFNNSDMPLEIRWGQATIKSGPMNQATIDFKFAFPNGCRFVHVGGNIQVIQGNSQILTFPLGNVSPSNITKDKFTMYGPTYNNVDFVFSINYLAIGW